MPHRSSARRFGHGTPAGLSTKEFVQAMQDYQSGKRTKAPKMARAAKKLSA